MQVQIPPDAPVGVWKLQVVTGDHHTLGKLKVYDCPTDIYVLFNPWCEGKWSAHWILHHVMTFEQSSLRSTK